MLTEVMFYSNSHKFSKAISLHKNVSILCLKMNNVGCVKALR